MKNDSLGNRMKRYELSSKQYLTRKIPVIVRCDGRAFHTYTKGFKRPFDDLVIKTMVNSAIKVVSELEGFKVAYIQSDEASFLLTDYDNIETQAWFDYNLSKIVSISSSVMSVYFNEIMKNALAECEDLEVNDMLFLSEKRAFFDARAFNIPKEDVANYFKWRQKDWIRNSLSMYCGSFYTQKEMQNKKSADQHEMLYKLGKNWAKDLNSQKKNGTFLYKKDKNLIEDTFYVVDYESFYSKFEV